jgi:hypothetical protein
MKQQHPKQLKSVDALRGGCFEGKDRMIYEQKKPFHQELYEFMSARNTYQTVSVLFLVLFKLIKV